MGAGADRKRVKRPLRVLGLLGDKQAAGAVEIYRITLPFSYMNKHGAICNWMPMPYAAECLRQGDTHAVFDYDVVVLHRCLADVPDAGEALIRALRVHGAKVVYETDDDYSGRCREADDVLNRTWKPYIPYVDAVTVTTKQLGERAQLDAGAGMPVYVIPNAVDRAWFAEGAQATRRLYPEHLTVMLAGTRSHYQDWIVLKEVIPSLLADYPNVKFLVVTEQVCYDYLWHTGAEFLPMVPYTRYPGVLAQADILCAPLVPDDPYNACKSPIKAIEGWCATRSVGKRLGGCAVVASKAPPYRGVVQNRHNGLLVEHTPEAWDTGLRQLIEDRVLRAELQIEGHKDARQYDIAQRWQTWHRAYSKIATGGNT